MMPRFPVRNWQRPSPVALLTGPTVWAVSVHISSVDTHSVGSTVQHLA